MKKILIIIFLVGLTLNINSHFPTMDTFNEDELTIESWMIEPNTWNNTENLKEDELILEDWMINLEKW